MQWTSERLERALRKALIDRASLKVRELPILTSADVSWTSETKAKMRVDNHEVALRAGVLHELIHFVLDDQLRAFDEQLQEPVVEALEAAMDMRIAMSKSRRHWWRREIERLRR